MVTPPRQPLLSERGIPDALPETQRPSPPRQPQRGPAHHAEFVTCDQTIEQSYKQVKYALGWNAYQVRNDQAMRRHWALVCCAFSFCWQASGEAAAEPAVVIESEQEPFRHDR